MFIQYFILLYTLTSQLFIEATSSISPTPRSENQTVDFENSTSVEEIENLAARFNSHVKKSSGKNSTFVPTTSASLSTTRDHIGHNRQSTVRPVRGKKTIPTNNPNKKPHSPLNLSKIPDESEEISNLNSSDGAMDYVGPTQNPLATNKLLENHFKVISMSPLARIHRKIKKFNEADILRRFRALPEVKRRELGPKLVNMVQEALQTDEDSENSEEQSDEDDCGCGCGCNCGCNRRCSCRKHKTKKFSQAPLTLTTSGRRSATNTHIPRELVEFSRAPKSPVGASIRPTPEIITLTKPTTTRIVAARSTRPTTTIRSITTTLTIPLTTATTLRPMTILKNPEFSTSPTIVAIRRRVFKRKKCTKKHRKHGHKKIVHTTENFDDAYDGFNANILPPPQ